jgi:hypothetical protein
LNDQTRLSDLYEHLVGDAAIDGRDDARTLSIGPATQDAYVDAQLDDYSGARPFQFVHRASLRLRLEARFSHANGVLKGTAGFGFWNHPFGPGGGLIPRSVWFFYGSPESDMRFARDSAGHGFRAAMLDALPLWRRPSPLTAAPDPAAIPRKAAIDEPNSAVFHLAERLARSRLLIGSAVRMAQRIFHARERALTFDMTAWHAYEIEWHANSVRWRVDGDLVLQCDAPPGPLGFVAWIDNYVAHFSPAGRYGFSLAESHTRQSLEIKSFDLAG